MPTRPSTNAIMLQSLVEVLIYAQCLSTTSSSPCEIGALVRRADFGRVTGNPSIIRVRLADYRDLSVSVPQSWPSSPPLGVSPASAAQNRCVATGRMARACFQIDFYETFPILRRLYTWRSRYVAENRCTAGLARLAGAQNPLPPFSPASRASPAVHRFRSEEHTSELH